MKAKITRGNNFLGVLNYALNKHKRAEIVAGNMFGRTASELAHEFLDVSLTCPDIKKPVFHSSLSAAPGEHLTDQQWDAVTRDYLQYLKFDLTKTPYVVVRHCDKFYDHVHIIVSRVSEDGSLWHGNFEALRAISATQRIEKEHNLVKTKGLIGDDKKRPTRSEQEIYSKSGVEPPRVRLQNFIDRILQDKNSTPKSAKEFSERLEALGVKVFANIASTGRMNGFSFELDSIHFKSSQLGRNYGWKSLQQQGVSFGLDENKKLGYIDREEERD